MDFLDIERRFSNLETLWGGAGMQVRIFEDPSRANAFHKLISLQRLLRNETELFEPFLQWLSHLHWDFRGYLGSSKQATNHWSMRAHELSSHFLSLRHAMDAVRLEAVRELETAIHGLITEDSAYADFICAVVEPENSIVLVERQWQRRFVTEFLSTSPHLSRVAVSHIAAFLKSEKRSFQNIYVLAPPSRIQDNFMRALVLGGAIKAATFLAPNWIAGKEPQKLRHDLVPGLTSVRKPSFAIHGEVFLSDVSWPTEEEFEVFSFSPNHGEFEKFTNNGAAKCRLIEIANDYVMPIELAASRVSVLCFSAEGALEVQYRTPEETLEVGDILFDLRDGAEEDFLMEAARDEMGDLFDEFAEGRAEWKSRARNLINRSGLSGAISFLKRSGVGTADHLSLWLDNDDFTTLRSNKDWKNLLVALEFEQAEVDRIIKLGSELRKNLIEIGRKARLHMSDSVSQEDLDRIMAHQVVTKQLDEFGDAVFVIGMVTALGNEQKNCEPHEIRRVLRR